MTGGSVMGPALGYITGGALIKLYVDFPQEAPSGLTLEHPAWVGAWWLGFVIAAALGLISTVFLLCFPRELPSAAEVRAQRVSQAHNDGTEDKVKRSDFGLTWKDMPKATWYLLKNPPFMLISLSRALEFVVTGGFTTFLPKILANQFGVTGFESSIVTGVVAVLGAVMGQLFGGLIIKKLNLQVVGMMRLFIVTSAVALAASPFLLAKCPESQLAGVHMPYPGDSHSASSSLVSECNEDCGCSTTLYDPVCVDGIQYFTPCHAGCSQPAQIDDETGEKIYRSCGCIGYNSTTLTNISATEAVPVKSGVCEQKCYMMYYVFVPAGFVIFFAIFCGYNTSTMLVLRVVPDKQRSFAIAIYWVFNRFLGTIPGPIIVGAVIDLSCILWEDNCGEKGSCWVSDNIWLSYYLTILVTVLEAVKLLLTVLALVLYKPQHHVAEQSSKSTEMCKTTEAA